MLDFLLAYSIIINNVLNKLVPRTVRIIPPNLKPPKRMIQLLLLILHIPLTFPLPFPLPILRRSKNTQPSPILINPKNKKNKY